MTWTAPAPSMPDGPLVGDERPILEAFLDWQRATLLNICAGLTADQLALRSADPSNLSLLGLIRHLTKVERIWFRQRVGGEAIDPLFDATLGKDTDFEDIDAAQAHGAIDLFLEECRLARSAVAGVSLEESFVVHGEPHSLRVIYLHMIAEYARHNGHADTLRQRIDGVTGR